VKTFAWVTVGGILLLAVVGHPAFLNLQVAGLILIGRGLAGFWFGASPENRAYYIERIKTVAFRGATTYEAFSADLAEDGCTRVPLDDLLARRQ
jgi:hypothetical protein